MQDQDDKKDLKWPEYEAKFSYSASCIIDNEGKTLTSNLLYSTEAITWLNKLKISRKF